jgi:hypothetical protein
MATLSQQHNRRPDITFFILLALASALVIFLSSCSCDYHYGRLAKKCKLKQDTLLVHDTIVTQNVTKDTIFKYFTKDTVIVREGKLTMKYFYNSHDSTVYLNGRCAPDTIIREIRVTYDYVQPKVDYFPGWLKWCVITMLALIIIGFILKKLT